MTNGVAIQERRILKSVLKKAKIQSWLDELSDEIPLYEMHLFLDKLIVLYKLERGRMIFNGRGTPHDEVIADLKRCAKKWSK